MVGIKDNRRTQFTKTMIQRAFLNLLQQKDLGQITVTDIAKAADINRGTFYNYYTDAFDLFHQIETTFFTDVLKSIQADKNNFYQWLEDLLSIFQKNRELALIILENQTDEEKFNTLLNEVRPEALQHFAESFQTTSTSSLELYFSYFVSGTLGCIKTWLGKFPTKTPNDIAEILQKSFSVNITGLG